MNKVNLGIATYGRSYYLESADETVPGSKSSNKSIFGKVSFKFVFFVK